MGAEYFVFQFTAFKEHAFASGWSNNLHLIVQVNTQFPAIFFLPSCIQIHDHRIGAAFIIPELVKVFFVKGAFFIQRVMKLISGDTGIAGTVQVADKMIHQIEKSIFVRVVVPAVEPVYFIASYQIVVDKKVVVPYTRREKLGAGIKGD